MFIINLFVPTFVDFYDIGTVIEKSHIHLFNFFIIKRNQAAGEKGLKVFKTFLFVPFKFCCQKKHKKYICTYMYMYTRKVVLRKDKLN